jgi:hypothetical protein
MHSRTGENSSIEYVKNKQPPTHKNMQKKKVNFSQEVEMGMRTNIHNIPISNLDNTKAKPIEDSFRDNID